MTPLSASAELPPNLDDFLERVRTANPFTDNRVNGPAPDDVDVPEIHRQAFERLTMLAREASGERRGMGVLLLGEAGVGKSHLLARLQRWAGNLENACFIYLHNLQASPEHLPRSLLRAIMSVLTRGQARGYRGTPLYRLAAFFAREAFDYAPNCRPHWTEIYRAWERLVDRFVADPACTALADRNAFLVLFQFLHSSYREWSAPTDARAVLALRWLSGDWLDPEQAQRLGLPTAGPEEPVGLRDNQEVKQVLVALARVVQAHKVPLLLCFDQADNLETEQMAGLARFLEALIDSAPNLLVVTAGIQESLLGWREAKVIQVSAWDRLAQFEVSLQRVPAADMGPLVTARVDHFLQPYREVPEVVQRRQADPLFPLGQAWLDQYLAGRVERRPRDVINAAREAWHRQQEALRQQGNLPWLTTWSPLPEHHQPVPLPTEDQIREAIDRRVSQELDRYDSAGPLLPPDPDHLANLLAALLKDYRQADPSSHLLEVKKLTVPRSGGRPAFDLLLRFRDAAEREVSTGLLCLVSDSAQSTTAALSRILHHAPRRNACSW